jgi:hypothetical protein
VLPSTVYTKEDPAVAVLKNPFNTLLELLHETPTLNVGASGVIPPPPVFIL